jgi:hypothetical protein
MAFSNDFLKRFSHLAGRGNTQISASPPDVIKPTGQAQLKDSKGGSLLSDSFSPSDYQKWKRKSS